VDDYGLDGKGLVALKDGTFWASDEYGSHLAHFDNDGVEMGRINAFKDDSRHLFHLPAVSQDRCPNRGMKSLAITADETTLVGMMQSTIKNPTKCQLKTSHFNSQ
jgi:hypothetical protein